MKYPRIDEARKVLSQESELLAGLLTAQDVKIVFAESCTGGLVAATLAGIPGASDILCGSLVTYRDDAKSKWLGISPRTLKKPGAVSEQVALEMAIHALEVTPEAGLSASITGHLGPLAPANQDGVIHCGIALRSAHTDQLAVFSSETQLAAPDLSPNDLRLWRQLAASHSLLMMVRSLLEQMSEFSESNEMSETHGVRRKKKWNPSPPAPQKARKKTKRSN
jgi:nicotinamide-nucleotide amidase